MLFILEGKLDGGGSFFFLVEVLFVFVFILIFCFFVIGVRGLGKEVFFVLVFEVSLLLFVYSNFI